MEPSTSCHLDAVIGSPSIEMRIYPQSQSQSRINKSFLPPLSHLRNQPPPSPTIHFPSTDCITAISPLLSTQSVLLGDIVHQQLPQTLNVIANTETLPIGAVVAGHVPWPTAGTNCSYPSIHKSSKEHCSGISSNQTMA